METMTITKQDKNKVELDYKQGNAPTLQLFHKKQARYRCIVGPV